MKLSIASSILLQSLSAIVAEAADDVVRHDFVMTAAPDFGRHRRQFDNYCSVGETACPDGNGCCERGSKCTSSRGIALCADACDIGAARCTFNGVTACCPLGSSCDYGAATPGVCTATNNIPPPPPLQTSDGDDDDGGSGGLGGGGGGGSDNTPTYTLTQDDGPAQTSSSGPAETSSSSPAETSSSGPAETSGSGSSGGGGSGGSGSSGSDDGDDDSSSGGSNGNDDNSSGGNGNGDSGNSGSNGGDANDKTDDAAASGLAVSWMSLGLAMVLGVGVAL